MTDKSDIIKDALRINPAVIERKLTAFIRKKVVDAGAEGAVVGLSGGVDSSVVGSLCTKALGPKKVIGILMPEDGVTDPQDVIDAQDLARDLEIDFKIVNITSIIDALHRKLGSYKADATLANVNVKPRIRMVILYYHANFLNRLVVGGGNKSELRTGYFTKYGDGAADLLPLGSLYKTQVIQLARHLNLPKKIIEKTPTAGLWKGQTDEGELGIQYKELDMIFAGLDLGLKPKVIAASTGVDFEKIQSLIERERRTSHKLRMPDVSKL